MAPSEVCKATEMFESESLARFMPRKHKTYSDSEKAETLVALDLNGGNLSKTQRDTGVPINTIKDWRDGKVTDDVTKLRTGKKIELSQVFEDLAYKLTGALNEDTVAKMSGQQLMTSAGIAVDKMRLLRDQATTISATETDLAKELYRRLRLNEYLKDCTQEEFIRMVLKRFPGADIQELEGVN